MRSYRSHGANWLICCSLDLWLCKAARLLREARVEVNRLKAALQRQGHFERTKEVKRPKEACVDGHDVT